MTQDGGHAKYSGGTDSQGQLLEHTHRYLVKAFNLRVLATQADIRKFPAIRLWFHHSDFQIMAEIRTKFINAVSLYGVLSHHGFISCLHGIILPVISI